MSAQARTANSFLTIRSLLGDSVLFGAGRLVAAVASIVLVPVYTRHLSVAEYGAVENVNILLNLVVGVFALALPEALFRYLPAADTEGDRRRLVATCSFLSLAAGAAGALLCVALADWFGPAFLSQLREQGRPLMVACGALTFVTIQFGLVLAALRITLQRAAYVASSVGALVISLASAVVFVAVLRLGPLGVFLGPAIGTGLVYLIMAARIRRLYSLASLDLGLGRQLLGFSLPLVPVSLFLFVIRSSDRYFISMLLPNALHQVGLYATAEKILAPLTLAGAGFSLAWGPFAMHAARQANAPALFRTAFGYYVGLTSLGVVGLAAAAQLILRIFTPPAYHASSAYVPVVGVYLALNSLHYVGSVGLLISGRTRLGVPLLAAAAGLNVALNFVLIPRYGVFGAAWATVASFVAYDILMFRRSERLFLVGFPVWRGLGAYAASFVGASLALGRPLLGVAALAAQVAVVILLGLVDWRELTALWSQWRPRRRACTPPSS